MEQLLQPIHKDTRISILKKYEVPYFGVVQLLHRCMAKCKMCKMWLGKKGSDELENDEFKKLFTDIASVSKDPFELNILGGETLMKDNCEDLFSHAIKVGLRPIVSTNGYLIDEERAYKLYKSGLIHYTMSLDSLDPKVHDYYRGTPGAFEYVRKALTNLENFYRGKQFVCIVAVIMKHNYKGLVELAKWARADPRICSVSYLVLTNPRWTNKTEWHKDETSKNIWPDDDQIPEVKKAIKELMHMKQNGYEHTIVNPIEQFEAFLEYYDDPTKPISYNYSTFKGYVMVKHNGETSMSGEMLGYLREQDFKTMWFSEKALKARRNIETKDTNVEIIINCKHGFEQY